MEVFDDAGHALFVDDSDKFNALLEDFLAGRTVTVQENLAFGRVLICNSYYWEAWGQSRGRSQR